MAQTAFTPRRWTRAEYDHLIRLGAFAGERIELIGGELLVAEPQGAYHSGVVGVIDRVLQRIVPAGWIVRCQLPIALEDDSEPEPDFAIVAGDHTDYLIDRPALIIEVAASSLSFDRRHKSSLYARGGVEDYWIVSVAERTVEVHRHPIHDATAPYWWRYRSIERVTPPAVITPLALPAVAIPVAELAP